VAGCSHAQRACRLGLPAALLSRQLVPDLCTQQLRCCLSVAVHAVPAALSTHPTCPIICVLCCLLFMAKQLQQLVVTHQTGTPVHRSIHHVAVILCCCCQPATTT
jgi:hypothetical protein